MNRLIEQEAMNERTAYPLAALLDDVRRGVWGEIYAGGAPNADAFRRELQSDFLALVARKLNPPPVNPQLAAQAAQFGITIPVLSEDAKSHLRGTLTTLRTDIRNAIPRTTDRATRLHLQGAMYRIDEILDPASRARTAGN